MTPGVAAGGGAEEETAAKCALGRIVANPHASASLPVCGQTIAARDPDRDWLITRQVGIVWGQNKDSDAEFGVSRRQKRFVLSPAVGENVHGGRIFINGLKKAERGSREVIRHNSRTVYLLRRIASLQRVVDRQVIDQFCGRPWRPDRQAAEAEYDGRELRA